MIFISLIIKTVYMCTSAVFLPVCHFQVHKMATVMPQIEKIRTMHNCKNIFGLYHFGNIIMKKDMTVWDSNWRFLIIKLRTTC